MQSSHLAINPTADTFESDSLFDKDELLPLTDLDIGYSENLQPPPLPMTCGNAAPLLDVGALLTINECVPVMHPGTATTATPTCTPIFNLNSVDDRKVRRLIKNRESARKSRAKKKRTVANLELRVLALERENAHLRSEQMKLKQCVQQFMGTPCISSDVHSLSLQTYAKPPPLL